MNVLLIAIGCVVVGIILLWVILRLAGRAFAKGWKEEMVEDKKELNKDEQEE